MALKNHGWGENPVHLDKNKWRHKNGCCGLYLYAKIANIWQKQWSNLGLTFGLRGTLDQNNNGSKPGTTPWDRHWILGIRKFHDWPPLQIRESNNLKK